MPEEIDVACPGCNAIFGVPVSFCGQTAECAECGSMFEIPELREKQLDDTSTGAIKGLQADSGEATNTVRLSRTGIGMIPQLKDDYQLGAMPKNAKPPQSRKAPSVRHAVKPPASPSAPKPPAPQGISRPQSAPSPVTPASVPPSMGSAPTVQDIPPQQPLTTPAWTNIRIKKNENVIGVREVINSPAETAFLVVIPLIIAGAAGLLSQMLGSVVIPAVIVGVTCIVTFIVALIMSKNNSKKALIVTNQRSIAVIGKTRIEIKK